MKRFKLKTIIDENGNYHVINECEGGAAGAIPVNNVSDGHLAGMGQPEGSKSGEPAVKKDKKGKKKFIIFDDKRKI